MPTRQGVQHAKASQLGPSFQDGYDIAEPVVSGTVNTASSFWYGDDLHVVHRFANVPGSSNLNWATHFCLRGMRGRQPTIRWEASEQGTLMGATDLVVPSWSYNNRDWTSFASISRSTGVYVRVSHSAPFEQDLVYVWFQPPNDIRDYWDWLRSSVFSSQYVSGTTSETVEGSRIVDWTEARTTTDSTCGVLRPAQPFYGFKMQWTPTATKLCILSAALHGCGERCSRWVLQGIVDYLLESAESEASSVRSDWIFLIYPHMNPLGEICGSNRGWGSNMNIDPNRNWDIAGSPVAFLDNFKTIVAADVAGIGLTPDLIVDLHGNNPSDGLQYMYTSASDSGGSFYDLFYVREPTLDEWATLHTKTGWWITWLNTALSANMQLIYETNTQSTEAEQFSRGANFVKTISDAVTAGIL